MSDPSYPLYDLYLKRWPSFSFFEVAEPMSENDSISATLAICEAEISKITAWLLEDAKAKPCPGAQPYRQVGGFLLVPTRRLELREVGPDGSAAQGPFC